jgi:hypothetical protein
MSRRVFIRISSPPGPPSAGESRSLLGGRGCPGFVSVIVAALEAWIAEATAALLLE